MTETFKKRVLTDHKFVTIAEIDGWEFVERRNITGIVSIVAITEYAEIILVEQFRPPLQKNVIELPAGLVGDETGQESEDNLSAAKRELREETGYESGNWTYLTTGPPSPGIISELVTFYKATQLTKIDNGGGVEEENITVHTVKVAEAGNWLFEMEQQGLLVDPKLYLGLYFAEREVKLD